eukprot:SAG31_NODE_2830_length_5027_cov_3.418425_4_plen_68_part_00
MLAKGIVTLLDFTFNKFDMLCFGAKIHLLEIFVAKFFRVFFLALLLALLDYGILFLRDFGAALVGSS